MHRKTLVDTAYGKLQGYFTGHCLLFAGIPYAAAPVGARRFRPPEAPEPWTGVRDATHFGPMQPQGPSRFSVFMGPDPHAQSEDSLLLNVWTPAADDGQRPVLVFVHGGAWVSGSGSLPMYRGEAFAARHNLVAVSLNYRLAEGGGLYLGHRDADFATSGNTALLDHIAALYDGASADNVLVTVGAAEANFITASSLAEPGDGLAVDDGRVNVSTRVEGSHLEVDVADGQVGVLESDHDGPPRNKKIYLFLNTILEFLNVVIKNKYIYIETF